MTYLMSYVIIVLGSKRHWHIQQGKSRELCGLTCWNEVARILSEKEIISSCY